jgi:choline kinase
VAKLRAVVLAAGRGVRMGGERAKCLIPLAGGPPLLHYTLSGLAKSGISDTLIVTGFGHTAVEGFATEHASGMSLTFVRNARYASWGNFHSLRVALDQSPGFDVLAVNCDVVVPPAVFARPVEKDGDLVLAVERRPRLDMEDMRVELERDRVKAIGKGIKMVRSHGEFCGVSLIRAQAAAVYGDVCNRLEWSAKTGIYYEDVYARILDQVDTRAVWIEPGEYAEVDEPQDVDAAEQVVESHAGAWDGDAG